MKEQEMRDLIEEILDEKQYVIKNRVRGGKVKRKQKVSTTNRISFNNTTKKKRIVKASERIKRKRASKIAAKKRVGKKGIIRAKTARSNRLRKALGWDK